MGTLIRPRFTRKASAEKLETFGRIVDELDDEISRGAIKCDEALGVIREEGENLGLGDERIEAELRGFAEAHGDGEQGRERPARQKAIARRAPSQSLGRDRGADDLERRFRRGEVSRPKDLLAGVIPTPSYGVLIAPPKNLKTYFELNFIRAICESEPFLGLAVNGGTVLLLALELSEAQLAERLHKIIGSGWPRNLRYYVRETMPRVERPLEWLRGEILRVTPALAVIDTKEKFFGEMPHSANLFGSDYRESEAVRALAYETNCAILSTDHAKKASTGRNPFSDSVRTNGQGAGVDYQHELVYRLGAKRATLVCAGNDIAVQRIDLAVDLATMRFTPGDQPKGGRSDDEFQSALKFLRELFADGKARRANAIAKLAKHEGIKCSKKVLGNATRALGIGSKKPGKGWLWVPSREEGRNP